MNREQALAVLGLPEVRTKGEVENAYRRRIQAIANEAREDAENRELRAKCRHTALHLQQAKATLLTPKKSDSSRSRRPDGSVFATCDTSSKADAEVPTPPGTKRLESGVTSAETDKLMRGFVLASRYEIQEQIGRGGMGVVFSAFDRVRHEMVAVKVLSPELLSDSGARERFLTEAKIASNLSHANIVRVFDLQQADGITFLTMELLEGRNLRAEVALRFQQNKPLKTQQVLAWAAQLCDALEHAHGQTVHRDVKPENIWVCPDGTVKLMDFGIARLLKSSRATNSGTRLGTAYYMAPEQLAGREVDGRADQYSLSVVLYELLCGTIPQGAAEPVHKARKGVSAGVSRVIMCGLSSSPEQRYPDIGAFRQALVRKRVCSIPVRSLATTVALLVGLLVTYPLWPAPARERATTARTDAAAARTVWESLLADNQADLAQFPPPASSKAAQSWASAESAYEQEQYKDAGQIYSESRTAYELAETRAKQYLELFNNDQLRKYRDAFPEDEPVPTVLQLRPLITAKTLFQEAQNFVDNQDFDRASEHYERGIEELRQAAKTAEKLLRYQPAWEAFTKERNDSERSLKQWDNWRGRWRSVWPDDPTHQAKWNEFFTAASLEQTLASLAELSNRFVAADPRDWPKMTEEMSSISQELVRRLNEADAYLRDQAVKFVKEKKTLAAREAFTEIVVELKSLPDKEKNEPQKSHIRGVVAKILAEAKTEQTLEYADRALLEADAWLKEDPLAALRMYVELHARTVQAVKDLQQIRDRELAHRLSTEDPFPGLALEADLPPVGTSTAIDLGSVKAADAAAWNVTVYPNTGTGLESELTGERSAATVELGEIVASDAIARWPVRLASPHTTPKDVGYVFIEREQLKFMWGPARGRGFEAALVDLTLKLKSNVHEHSIRLRQLSRNAPLPVDFNQERQTLNLPLPVAVDQQKLRLELQSVRGVPNAQGLPLQLAVGQKEKVYLDDARTFCLEVMLRVGKSAPEVIICPLVFDGDEYRAMTVSDLERMVSNVERELSADRRELESAQQEYNKLDEYFKQLESALGQTSNDFNGWQMQNQIRTEMAFVWQRGKVLEAKIGRLYDKSIPNRESLLERVRARKDALADIIEARPSIQYRLFMPSQGEIVDLIVTNTEDS